jgi:hypothetical protein
VTLRARSAIPHTCDIRRETQQPSGGAKLGLGRLFERHQERDDRSAASASELAYLPLDPNVHIQEVKAMACEIRPGQRTRGPALRELILAYRRRAASRRTGTEPGTNQSRDARAAGRTEADWISGGR